MQTWALEQAEWRDLKAVEWPDDTRNASCAKAFRELAQWISGLPDDDGLLATAASPVLYSEAEGWRAVGPDAVRLGSRFCWNGECDPRAYLDQVVRLSEQEHAQQLANSGSCEVEPDIGQDPRGSFLVNPENYVEAQNRIRTGKWAVDTELGLIFGRYGRAIGTTRSDIGTVVVGLVLPGTHTTVMVQAHRVIWEYVHGPVTDPDAWIIHINGDRSDNRIGNLRVVSAYDALKGNTYGRVTAGEAHGNAKLTEEKVRAIRAGAAAGERISHLAAAFDVSTASVRKVIRHESWAHIDAHRPTRRERITKLFH
jgi:hypothetical protein